MKWLFVTIVSVCIIACKEKKGYVSKEENNGDEVYNIVSDDEAMNNAIMQAKTTFGQFLAAFENSESNMRNFTVKLRFPLEENSAEHMWLSELFHKDKKLYGVLDSDPVNVTTVKWGDTLEVKTEFLSDWMYVKNEKLVGGYTVRVLYDKMDAAEKKSFRNEIDFEIE